MFRCIFSHIMHGIKNFLVPFMVELKNDQVKCSIRTREFVRTQNWNEKAKTQNVATTQDRTKTIK